MKPAKAVVTGGAGFIGSHIVDELLARRIETIVVDDFSTGSLKNLSGHEGDKLLRVVRGPVKEIARLLSDVEGIDLVFHEAAIASVPRSVTDPMFVHDINVNSSLEVMNFCVDRSIRRMVFASSAAVYGRVERPPAAEDQICRPSSPYGASKFAVEAYMHSYYETYGLETVALRYFNVYGPRQKIDDTYSGVITIFACKLLQRQTPTIFGDGSQTRDFVNVKDIVNANMLAMDSDQGVGKFFNVASGASTSVLQLFETLKAVTGAEGIQAKFGPPRAGDVKLGTASIDKISSGLGFKPSVSLRAGLTELTEHLKSETVVSAVAT